MHALDDRVLTAHRAACPALQWLRSKRALLAFVFLLILECVAFLYYFKKQLAPFYLVNFDQFSTYMGAYESYFSLRDSRTLSDGFWNWVGVQKGMLLPILALVSVVLFGPCRLAINAINFAFLGVSQICLVWSVNKVYGRSVAGFALGLFLLSGTHFFQFGGLDDLRRDYSGMALSGLVFLSSWRFLSLGGRANFVFALFSFILLTLSRFVLIFPWIAGLVVLAGVIFLARGTNIFCEPSKLISRLVQLFVGPMIGCIVHLLASWKDFSGYYLQLKFTNEDSLRWTECGVHNLTDRLLYYPHSLWEHFHILLISSAAVFIAAMFLHVVFKRPKQVFSNDDSRQFTIGCALFLCTLVTAYVILTAYSPHPCVVGAFSIPLACCIAIGMRRVLQRHLSVRTINSLMLISTIGSISFFLYEFKRPPHPPHPRLDSARAVSRLMNSVVTAAKPYQGKPLTIQWLIFHDGLHGPAFLISWYENQRSGNPHFRHMHIPFAPPLPAEAYLEDLNKADLVVAPVSLPAPPLGWFEYPGVGSLRKHLPVLQPVLDRDFQRIAIYDGIYANQPNLWTVGVYKRVHGRTKPFVFKAGDDTFGLSHKDPHWAKYQSPVSTKQ